jgi:hypothetical protein
MVRAPKDDHSSEIMAELLTLEQRATENAELFAAGAITAQQLATISRSLQAQTDACRGRLGRQQGDSALRPYVGRSGVLRAAWDKLDLDGQRSVVAAIIEQVIVGPATLPRRHGFDPNRVEVRWRA